MPDSAASPFRLLTPYRLADLPAEFRDSVVVIGNFDGVHRGHQGLLAKATDDARRRRVRTLVVTFEPHPRTFFRPAEPVFRLTPIEAKAALLAASGIDGLVVLPFDRDLAATPAESFVDQIVVDRLRPAALVVGYDFRFGKGRTGNADLLAGAGARHGFDVEIVSAITDADGSLMSSTVIRDALSAGDIAAANRLLGYRWFVEGAIIGGDRRGRDLGFPTANIRLAADCRLRHGVYAVTMKRRAGIFPGVASFGRRPTFDNGAPLLEVFLFDFSGDLYGEDVGVTFHGWIRPEERFPDIESLIAAMNGDLRAARATLAAAGPGTAIDARLAAL